MANQRDINRWKKGKDHWNKWAEGRLKAKEKLEKEGKWEVDEYGQGTNTESKRWIKSATADFSKHVFDKDVEFDQFRFPHRVKFADTKFKGHFYFRNALVTEIALFNRAVFKKNALFDNTNVIDIAGFGSTIFEGIAGFGNVTFLDRVWFGDAKFCGNAWFDNVDFWGDVFFERCIFQRNAFFEKSKFHADARFTSSISKGLFSLRKTTFKRVPNLVQVSFRSPARLDDLLVAEAKAFQFEGDKNRAARYRALKKIAIENHDHMREQNFFANEARERRGNDDPRWSPAWLFSFPYEFLSDFGRSIASPFWWWCASTMTFWFVYLGQQLIPRNSDCKIDPTWEALYLSLKSAFLVIGWERSQKLNQVYSCLYGTENGAPNLPVAIPFLQMGQTLWSAILIFLFLLAVRNHFRIK